MYSKNLSSSKYFNPETLSNYHPIFIEGMGGRDKRDPRDVATTLVAHLRRHWSQQQSLKKERKPTNTKQFILIIQGDPIETTGISAITRLVASDLGIQRALITLDESIDHDHSRNADRKNTQMEFKLSQLEQFLDSTFDANNRYGEEGETPKNSDNPPPCNSIVTNIKKAIHERIHDENKQRLKNGIKPIKSYVKDYALLQEVSKIALKQLCGGDITIIHTEPNPNEFSVTGFYVIGMKLGFIETHDIVSWSQ